MNNQPLNLLSAAIGKNGPTNATSNPASTSGRQSSANLQHINNEQRQIALANLFSSLSSLANSQAQHNTNRHHQQHEQQQQPSIGNTHQAHQTQSQQPLATSTSVNMNSSIQSVMAAAMMQRQLVNAANQQQQLPQSNATATILTDQLSQKINNQQNSPMEMQRQQYQQQQQQQQQRINYCTICNKELCNKYFMKTHMLKMHKISLEMEQPEDEEAECGNSNEGSPSNDDDDHDAGEEKVNNNDRFCQPSPDYTVDSSKQQWSPNKSNNNSKGKSTKKLAKDNLAKKPTLASSNSSNNNKPATSVLNGFAGNSMGGVVCDICNKELCSKYFLKVHKQNTHGVMTDYQDAANQFMYPFAPTCGPNPFMASPAIAPVLSAPMGFNVSQSQPPPMPHMFVNPVPHHHNHHHLEAELPKTSGYKKSKSAKRLRLSGQQQSQVKQEPAEFNASGSSSVPGSGAAVDMEQKLNESGTLAYSLDSSPNKQQFESVYRLILAQQQQQQPVPVSTPQARISAQMGISFNEMPMTANPLSALMCFGAMGPTGPFGAAMSPAMIVDNILRNQHLFNRNNNNNVGPSGAPMQPPTATTKNKAVSGTDKNNNSNNNDSSNDPKQATNNSKASKDSPSNSRYFSHYTEACPMCDRRFKSIKWLKTHMMNDHKQEIATYMQMMMQYLYTSKSQQMAAAATMAAIEQQQHHQNQHLTQQFTQQSQLQIQPPSLLNKCFGQETLNQQLHSGNTVLVDQNQYKINAFSQQQPLQQQQQQQQQQSPSDMRICSPEFKVHHQEQLQQPLSLSTLDSYVIDARCRQESLSPDQESLIRQSPHSPSSSRSQMHNFTNSNSETSLNCGINFELSKLAEHRNKSSDEYLSNSPCEGSDELADEGEEEEDGDSDKSREAAN